MNQKNDNFIDKTFTVLADIILKVLPATKDEKQALELKKILNSYPLNSFLCICHKLKMNMLSLRKTKGVYLIS